MELSKLHVKNLMLILKNGLHPILKHQLECLKLLSVVGMKNTEVTFALKHNQSINILTKLETCITNPSFPEYTSGHSVVSTVSALYPDVHFFGDNFSFGDSNYNLRQTDHYPLMKLQEAAMSRFYGIHYRAAIENGIVQGKEMGVDKLIMK
jgi:hypothetical protein